MGLGLISKSCQNPHVEEMAHMLRKMPTNSEKCPHVENNAHMWRKVPTCAHAEKNAHMLTKRPTCGGFSQLIEVFAQLLDTVFDTGWTLF